MRDRNILFFEEDLEYQLRARQERVNDAVNGIPKDQFLVSSDADLITHVVASHTVEPLILCEDAITMSQNETQIDVSGDSQRYPSLGQSGPFFIQGTRVDIDIPFTGEEWIFSYRTNPWSSVFPHAEVSPNRVRISISQPHDAGPNAFKTTYDRELQILIRQQLASASCRIQQ